jgi:cytochrome c553
MASNTLHMHARLATMRPSCCCLAVLACGLLSLLIAGAAFAGPENTMAQRAKPCMSCHGDQGRATPEGYYPRIAGKPAGYLLHQLQAFRDGKRANSAMAYLLRGMPDRYLQEFADYFASQHPPYQVRAQASTEPQLLAEGKTLVLAGDAMHGIPACSACHGVDLAGRAPDIPGLLGVAPSYLAAQLGAWRVGLRHAKDPDCMAEIASKLDERQLDAAIAFISMQEPLLLPAAAPSAGPAAKLPVACGSVTSDFAQP